MGLYVKLYVQFDEIDEERWEAAYLTSLQLLENFPAPLARTVTQKVRGITRPAYTTDVVFDAGTPQERWEVDGDLASGRLGETYCLYRHRAHYLSDATARRRPRSPSARDILVVSGDAVDYPTAGGAEIFDAKSQGYPYHYVMLAVGVLIENSFPQHAVVMGDINRRQAEQVVAWAESVLGRDLRLPIVTDGPRLWSRLAEMYAGRLDAALRRFQGLMIAAPDQLWRDLLEFCPDEGRVRRAFQEQLDGYSSLKQRGATDLIVALAKADQGVERAIDWVCGSRPSGDARFSPDDLLLVLCHSFVTIPLDERESLKAFELPEQLANIEEVFMDVLALMAGRPRTVDFFLEEDDLLREFADRWPDREQHFREAIEAGTAKCREVLAAGLMMIDKLTKQEETRETESEAQDVAPLGVDLDDAAYAPAAEFLREEIQRQRQSTRSRIGLAEQMGEMIRDGLAANVTFRESLLRADREKLLDQISLASSQHGFALTEAAWRSIAQDATLDELRCLAVLALLNLREESFWQWRRHVLHSPDLWPVLAAAAS